MAVTPNSEPTDREATFDLSNSSVRRAILVAPDEVLTTSHEGPERD